MNPAVLSFRLGINTYVVSLFLLVADVFLLVRISLSGTDLAFITGD